MGMLSKIFRREAREVATGSKAYRERDNRGTRHDTLDKASAYWMARITSEKKDPYVMFTFDRADDARAALLELPCIHVAEDTQNLICTEVLVFGYYSTEEGTYEALVCGDDLTHELWQQARDSFTRHGGRRKNELEPEERKAKAEPAKGGAGKVAFVRQERQEKMGSTFVYRIHKAPDAASAQEFLAENPVTKPLLYLIVETPQGNYCRDIDGIYKE